MDGRQVLRCGVCSHVYLNDEHTHETIADLYEKQSARREPILRQHGRAGDGERDGYLRTSRALPHDGAGASFARYWRSGGLMERAQALDFRVEGVEICQPLADHWYGSAVKSMIVF